MQEAIFNEELVRAHVPSAANLLGLTMGGPMLIEHGTEEQKGRFLQPILSGEEIWCQGFSEPGAGSDLASVTTHASRSGREWIVTGQKVWTSLAHHSTWCMLVARTNEAPRHRGLTFFLMDMHQEGVDVRPLRQITGEAEFNELFIDGARIPEENVIGGEGNGWSVTMTTLMYERSMLAFGLQVQAQIHLRELIDEITAGGAQVDAVTADRVARLYVENEILRLNALRGLSTMARDGVPGPEGSLCKWQWAETNQALTELAHELRGARGVVADRWSHRYLRARANSIEGGTTEILKNIIAERVLGLPRMR